MDLKLTDGCDLLAHETGQTWPSLPSHWKPHLALGLLLTSLLPLLLPNCLDSPVFQKKKKCSFCLNHLRGPPFEFFLICSWILQRWRDWRLTLTSVHSDTAWGHSRRSVRVLWVLQGSIEKMKTRSLDSLWSHELYKLCWWIFLEKPWKPWSGKQKCLYVPVRQAKSTIRPSFILRYMQRTEVGSQSNLESSR